MKWLYGILCLFLLVIIHEFGHFFAAKLFGVKVESFSFGFGPVLVHKKIKGTDWRLSLIPLGGYCGMKGEKELNDALNSNSSLKCEPDSLYGVHPLKRAAIGFAGPLFNLIFTIFAFTIINLTGYTYYTASNTITLADEIYPEIHSAARDAGLLSGDKIIKINEIIVNDFTEIRNVVITNPDKDLEVTVNRNEEIVTFIVHTDFDKENGIGKIGIVADPDSYIEKEAESFDLFHSISKGTKDTFNTIKLTFKSIGILFKGVKIQNAVSGPARITEMLGSTVKEGFGIDVRTGVVSILEMLAYISVSLFIMNLLPIPILDGGLILFALIETIIKKKIPPKVQYYTQFIGLAFIAILFIIGLFGDITYFTDKIKMRK
ncbi:MAG: site-2 protease family protein [Treponema sp.]|nr:site-2 protease family protein [Treponema sp.]